MPQFSYEAADASGRSVRGTVDAEHRDAAMAALQLRGLTVSALSELPDPMPIAQRAPHSSPEDGPHHDRSSAAYFPLMSTLRIYAGWLLAYYGMVYALGWYQRSQSLPWNIPFVESLMLSPLVLQFTLAAFLFLLGGSLNAALRVPRPLQILTWTALTALFVYYRMNIL